jgi:hypothetical protein
MQVTEQNSTASLDDKNKREQMIVEKLKNL